MFKRHVIDELSSYLDNQLSEEQRLKIEEHLNLCKSCSEELFQLKLLLQKLKTLQVPGLSSEFEAVLKNEIVQQELQKGEAKMKRKPLAILIPSGVLAGILVFLLVGQIYVKRGMQPRLKDSSDDIGEQFAPGYSTGQSQERAYEPYYTMSAGGAKGSLEGWRRMAGGSNQSSKQSIDSGWALSTGSMYADYNEPTVRYMAREREGTQGFGDYAYEEKKPDTTGTEVKTAYLGSGVAGELGGIPPSGEGSVIVIQPILPATGQGERIIRTAQIRLEVGDGQEAYKKASLICQESGGYLSSSTFYKDSEARESATITMRIPKDKFLEVLDKLGVLGKVENITTQSQDISQEYANIKTQLDAAMVVYNKMLEALQKRQVTIPEAMRLESELTPVLRRVEDFKNKLEYLNNAVSFTTITVRFHEPNISVKLLKETQERISESFLTAKINALKFLIHIIPNIIIYAIILAVFIAVFTAAVFLVRYLIVHSGKRE